MNTVFALVDCNNFFVSCERAFNPALEGKAIVVLSNNDGCIISRSNEAKQLGIPMGAPYYQWKKIISTHGVRVFSSNFELYGDMSQRIMIILETFCPEIEIYSIDEAFLSLSSFAYHSLTTYAQDIRLAIKKWLGLPVAIGIAPTKTLAKVATHLAKKTTAGVYNLCDPSLQEKILADFPIEQLWGIGRQTAKRLHLLNIYTAKELRDSDQKQLRQELSIVMERMIEELRGHACLSLETVQARKQIMSSRSFAHLIHEIEPIEEALSHYIANACEKLREQQSYANALCVFLRTNHFSQKDKQYANSITIRYAYPTNNSSYMITLAKAALKKIFRTGYHYHKVGVILLELIPDTIKQMDLFLPEQVGLKSDKLMATIDHINTLMGRHSLQFCAEGIQKKWRMKCDLRSPRYTTRKNELKIVKCE